jgi:hypothetical protein
MKKLFILACMRWYYLYAVLMLNKANKHLAFI